MAEHPVHVDCDECGAHLHFSDADAGTVQECRKCGNYMDIPQASTEQTVVDEQTATCNRRVQAAADLNEVSRRQQEQYQTNLDRSAALATRQEAVWEQFACLLTRWEALTDRIDRVVAALEQSTGTPSQR